MPKAARKGDTVSGHGCFPPTQITSGSGDVTINGQPAARVGDSCAPHGCKDCPPHGRTIAVGSSSVFINGKPAARVGDGIDCGGVIITGSDNVHIGGGSAVYAVDAQDNYQALSDREIAGLSTDEWNQIPADAQAEFSHLRTTATRQEASSSAAPEQQQSQTKQQQQKMQPQAQEQKQELHEQQPQEQPEPFAAGFIWVREETEILDLYIEHYGSFDSKKLSYFRSVNSHLNPGRILPGELVIFANPPITAEDETALAALQRQARLASQGIQQLSPEEAATVVNNFALLDAVNSNDLANTSAAVGVTSAMVSQRLKELHSVLVKLNQNYMNNVEVVNGKARFGSGFYTGRAKLFRELDYSLSRLTMLSLNIPVSAKVKHTLELSSKSLLHNWDEVIKAGHVPQLGERINIVARTARGAKHAGHIGIALDMGVSANEVIKACYGADTSQCKIVKYKEGGRFIGSAGGGYYGAELGGGVAIGIAGSIALALGVTFTWPVIAVIGIGGAAVGAYGGSSIGGTVGENIGEVLFEYSGE